MPITLTRSLLVVFIPGMITIAPWIFLFIEIESTFSDLYKQYFYIFNVMLAGIAVIAGSVIEGVVTHIECQWDEKLENEFQVEDNWFAYLSNIFDSEPVGYRYMSRMATTLYFELGMACASASFILGIIAIFYYFEGVNFATYNALLILLLLISEVYFYRQAKSSHKVLCKARREINQRVQAMANKSSNLTGEKDSPSS